MFLVGGLNIVEPRATDFASFYVAGSVFHEGDPRELYDLDRWRSHVGRVTGAQKASPFVSPPFVARAFSPLSRFPLKVAYVFWAALSVVLLVASVWTLRRALPLSGRPNAYWMALCFLPVCIALIFGQLSLVGLLLLSVTYALLRQGAEVRAGLVHGLLAFKPPLLLGFLLVGVFKLRWRFVLATMASCACVWILGYLSAPEQTAQYVEAMPRLTKFLANVPTSATDGLFTTAQANGDPLRFPNELKHSVFAIGPLLLGPHASSLWIGYVCAAVLVAFCAIVWRNVQWHVGSARWDLAVAVSLCIGLLISPHLYHYDLAMGLLPFLIVVAHRGSTPLAQHYGRVRSWSAIVHVTLFVGLPLVVYAHRTLRAHGIEGGVLHVVVLMLIAWTVVVAQSAGLVGQVVGRSTTH